MALTPPERVWWKRLGRQERLWLGVSLVFIVVLFSTMPLWHLLAQQNTPHLAYRVSPERYIQLTNDFIARYQVGEEAGIPVVRPPEGDVYLLAMQFQWMPILELTKGKMYRLHVSSVDVNHGFSIQPVNMNFQIVPGYDYVLILTPSEAGEYTIVCNEYCGLAHHKMTGKILVKE